MLSISNIADAIVSSDDESDVFIAWKAIGALDRK